jgi:hypothetical protein
LRRGTNYRSVIGLKKIYLGVEFVKDVLQVVALNAFLRVKQFEELLDELRGNEHFELTDLNRLVDNELQKEFVNSLQMRPGGIHLLILIDTSL